MSKSYLYILLIVLVCFVSQATYAQVYVLIRVAGEVITNRFPMIVKRFLSDDEIARLAQYAKNPEQLGKEVGRLHLSEDVLTDTFLRVAIKNGVLDTTQEAAIRKMGNVDGLASLLSKINSVNPNQVKGHLKELNIGIACNNRGGKVLAFGKKFNDGIKKADTDLDVLVQMNGKKFALESKAYDTEIGTDIIRADLLSLEHYCTKIQPNTIAVFCFDKTPPELAQRVLQSKNVDYFTGTGEEICTKLALLAY